MRLFPVFIFLTLVWSAPSSAAPSAPTPKPGPVPGAAAESLGPAQPDPTKIETIQVAPTGEPGPEDPVLSAPAPRWLPEGFSIHLGGLGGQVLERDETLQSALLGIQWSHDFPSAKTWDFQFDVGANAWLRIGTARRFYFSRERQYLPYWKLALFQTTETSRVFAGFVDLERVKFTAALGLADLLERDSTLNAEFGAGWGLNGVAIQMQVGWGF